MLGGSKFVVGGDGDALTFLDLNAAPALVAAIEPSASVCSICCVVLTDFTKQALTVFFFLRPQDLAKEWPAWSDGDGSMSLNVQQQRVPFCSSLLHYPSTPVRSVFFLQLLSPSVLIFFGAFNLKLCFMSTSVGLVRVWDMEQKRVIRFVDFTLACIHGNHWLMACVLAIYAGTRT